MFPVVIAAKAGIQAGMLTARLHFAI